MLLFVLTIASADHVSSLYFYCLNTCILLLGLNYQYFIIKTYMRNIIFIFTHKRKCTLNYGKWNITPVYSKTFVRSCFLNLYNKYILYTLKRKFFTNNLEIFKCYSDIIVEKYKKYIIIINTKEIFIHLCIYFYPYCLYNLFAWIWLYYIYCTYFISAETLIYNIFITFNHIFITMMTHLPLFA